MVPNGGRAALFTGTPGSRIYLGQAKTNANTRMEGWPPCLLEPLAAGTYVTLKLTNKVCSIKLQVNNVTYIYIYITRHLIFEVTSAKVHVADRAARKSRADQGASP